MMAVLGRLKILEGNRGKAGIDELEAKVAKLGKG